MQQLGESHLINVLEASHICSLLREGTKIEVNDIKMALLVMKINLREGEKKSYSTQVSETGKKFSSLSNGVKQ